MRQAKPKQVKPEQVRFGLVNIDDDFLGLCPECRSRLVKRTNKKTGNEFAGCSSWPKCKYTFPPSSLFWDDEHGNSFGEEDDWNIDSIDTNLRWDGQ